MKVACAVPTRFLVRFLASRPLFLRLVTGCYAPPQAQADYRYVLCLKVRSARRKQGAMPYGGLASRLIVRQRAGSSFRFMPRQRRIHHAAELRATSRRPLPETTLALYISGTGKACQRILGSHLELVMGRFKARPRNRLVPPGHSGDALLPGLTEPARDFQGSSQSGIARRQRIPGSVERKNSSWRFLLQSFWRRTSIKWEAGPRWVQLAGPNTEMGAGARKTNPGLFVREGGKRPANLIYA